MSIVQTKGENIVQATNLLKETYKNLNILFQELDRVGKEQGYVTINPRFMRYKSDTDPDGWMTTNFIKLYVKGETVPSGIEEIRDLPWYGVMVDLNDDEDLKIPLLTIVRYQFDQSYWTRIPAVSDYWTFWSPFFDAPFNTTYEDGKWTILSEGNLKKKHSGFEKLEALDIPLFDVKSPEDVRSKVFEGFNMLNF